MLCYNYFDKSSSILCTLYHSYTKSKLSEEKTRKTNKNSVKIYVFGLNHSIVFFCTILYGFIQNFQKKIFDKFSFNSIFEYKSKKKVVKKNSNNDFLKGFCFEIFQIFSITSFKIQILGIGLQSLNFFGGKLVKNILENILIKKEISQNY